MKKTVRLGMGPRPYNAECCAGAIIQPPARPYLLPCPVPDPQQNNRSPAGAWNTPVFQP
jgi:hypothetical protein